MTIVDHLKAEMKAEMKAEFLKQGIEKGIEKGIEQGIEQGRKERDAQMAKTLLLKGIDIDIISETTGLSKEEIRKFYS